MDDIKKNDTNTQVETKVETKIDTDQSEGKLDNKQVLEMAEELRSCKLKKEELDKEIKEVNAKIDEIDEKLSNAMTEIELNSFKHQGATFYLKSRLFASPIEGKKDEMIQALKDSGNGELVVEQVNSNTLASFIKEQREQNNCDDVPEYLKDIVSTYEKISVGIRNSKK